MDFLKHIQSYLDFEGCRLDQFKDNYSNGRIGFAGYGLGLITGASVSIFVLSLLIKSLVTEELAFLNPLVFYCGILQSIYKYVTDSLDFIHELVINISFYGILLDSTLSTEHFKL